MEAESSCSGSEEEADAEEAGDSENDIRQLKARRHALANKLAKQQKRRDKIQVSVEVFSFSLRPYNTSGCHRCLTENTNERHPK